MVKAVGSFRYQDNLLVTGLLLVVPGLLILGLLQPFSPDLIAQLSRAAMSRATEGGTWVTSWYGGMTMPSYSVIVPQLLRVTDVWTLGISASLITIAVAAKILEGRARAHLAITMIAIAVLADLASGRTTFAVGAACGTACVLLFLRNRTYWAALFGVLAWLSSPLAGFFLLMIMACAAIQKEHRTSALIIAVATGLTGGILALAFPSKGYMSMTLFELLVVVGASGIILWARPGKFISRLAIGMGVLAIALFAVKNPIGINLIRLPLLFAAPAVVTTSSLRPRKLAVGVAIWIACAGGSAIADLYDGSHPSSKAKFYAPLLAQLPESGTAQHRIEVIDPATHGPALHIAEHLPLARGWERQSDRFNNPLFFDGTLNEHNYRKWLDDNAVRWVALPDAPLDYSSKDEAKLVQKGLPYLAQVWENDNWKLFEVIDPLPMAEGVASVKSVHTGHIELFANAAGGGVIKARGYSGLELVNVIGGPDGEVFPDGTSIRYTVPVAGTYILREG